MRVSALATNPMHAVYRLPGDDPVLLPIQIDPSNGLISPVSTPSSIALEIDQNTPSQTLLDVVDDAALEGLAGVFPNITRLSIKHAKCITTLHWLSHCESLEELRVEECPSLQDIEGIYCLKKLVSLSLRGCAALTTPLDLSQLPKLKMLDIIDTGMTSLSN